MNPCDHWRKKAIAKNESLSMPSSRIPNLLLEIHPLPWHRMCANRRKDGNDENLSISACCYPFPCCASWIVKQRSEISENEEILDEWMSDWNEIYRIRGSARPRSVEWLPVWVCYNKIVWAISLVAETACCSAVQWRSIWRRSRRIVDCFMKDSSLWCHADMAKIVVKYFGQEKKAKVSEETSSWVSQDRM